MVPYLQPSGQAMVVLNISVCGFQMTFSRSSQKLSLQWTNNNVFSSVQFSKFWFHGPGKSASLKTNLWPNSYSYEAYLFIEIFSFTGFRVRTLVFVYGIFMVNEVGIPWKIETLQGLFSLGQNREKITMPKKTKENLLVLPWVVCHRNYKLNQENLFQREVSLLVFFRVNWNVENEHYAIREY